MEDVTDSLALFRQMKASVRGSENYLLVGIDVAKNKHHAFLGTPNGRTLRKNLVFDNSIKGFERLRSLVSDIRNQHGLVKVVYGLEPTASYHKPLAEYLIRQDEHVVYVSTWPSQRIEHCLMAAGTKTTRRTRPTSLILSVRVAAFTTMFRKSNCGNCAA